MSKATQLNATQRNETDNGNSSKYENKTNGPKAGNESRLPKITD